MTKKDGRPTSLVRKSDVKKAGPHSKSGGKHRKQNSENSRQVAMNHPSAQRVTKREEQKKRDENLALHARQILDIIVDEHQSIIRSYAESVLNDYLRLAPGPNRIAKAIARSREANRAVLGSGFSRIVMTVAEKAIRKAQKIAYFDMPAEEVYEEVKRSYAAVAARRESHETPAAVEASAAAVTTTPTKRQDRKARIKLAKQSAPSKELVSA